MKWYLSQSVASWVNRDLNSTSSTTASPSAGTHRVRCLAKEEVPFTNRGVLVNTEMASRGLMVNWIRQQRGPLSDPRRAAFYIWVSVAVLQS